jgi:hypothetical protein
MATKTEYEVDESISAYVKDEETLKQMKEDGQLKPFSNYFTPDEDENISYLRVETLYDMNDNSKNWGYPSGIPTGTTISNKDFSKYEYLKVYSIRPSDDYGSTITLVPLDKQQDGGGYVGRGVIYLVRLSSVNSLLANTITTVVNSAKTEFTVYFTQQYNATDYYETAYRVYKIEGVLKEPAMIYTGAELHEGDGISIKDGVISNNNIIVDYTVPSDTSQVNIDGLDIIGDGGVYEISFYSHLGMNDYLYMRFNNKADAGYYDRYNTFMDSPISRYLAAQSSFVVGAFPKIANITLLYFGSNAGNGVGVYANGQGIVSGQYATFLTMGNSSSDTNITSIQLFSMNSNIPAGTRIIVKRTKYSKRGTAS